MNEAVRNAWERLRNEVEGDEFSTICNLASGYHMFQRILREHKLSRQLRVFARYHHEPLRERIEELAKMDYDRRYNHPQDVAMCAYALALYDQSQITVAGLKLILANVYDAYWVQRALIEENK